MEGDGMNVPTEGSKVLPEPPGLAWGWIVLLQFVTFGFFPLYYTFVQARWVRRIDSKSGASTWILIATVCWVGYFLMFSVPTYLAMFSPGHFGRPQGLGFVAFLLMAGGLGFGLAAWFSMAESLRRRLPEYGLVPSISGVYVFFFNVIYLQGQLLWVRRWQQTGELEPRPVQGELWWLLLLWFIVSALVQFTLHVMIRTTY